MKIAEVKPGTEYGATDSKSRMRYETPRQVKAVAIVPVEERVYPTHSFMSDGPSFRTVRRVEVKFLDDPPKNAHNWDKVASAKKGSKLVIEARQLAGAWSDIAPQVAAKHKEEQEAARLKKEYTARLRKLGLGSDFYILVSGNGVQLSQWGYHTKTVDKLLTLAEAGRELLHG